MLNLHIQTLQQKTVLFVLLPTFLFLSSAGLVGFFFAQKSLLIQWAEVANANLHRAAHLVDMRLARPKEMLERLEYVSGTGMEHLTLKYTLEQLQKMEGVASVKLNSPPSSHGMNGMGGHRSTPLRITSPQYVWKNGHSSISLLSKLVDPATGEGGSIEVIMSVADLVEQIAQSDWWKSNKTLLIDTDGNIIAQSSYSRSVTPGAATRQFGLNDQLESKTLEAILEKSSGTVFGEGNPPEEISGFYRLSDAPWYMVVLAPGGTVLKPILTFSLYYGLLLASAIIIIIIFIRSMTARMTRSIQRLSVAADGLANGIFGPPLSVRSHDEIGELTKSFNTMSRHIKQGVELQKAMEIAREVQQKFLPDSRYVADGLDIYGACRYSQETGGDFYDFIRPEKSYDKIDVVVGDVVGHGVGAALLMASIRAMLRARNDQPGNCAQIISDVNRVLCWDTEASCDFVTLFYLQVDWQEKKLEWVRAGHDPALLLYPQRQECKELHGRGVALGVERSFEFESNTIEITPEPQLVIIGSDGAWEAENAQGERFGRQHLIDILKANSSEAPEVLIECINSEIDNFLDGILPQDDITFVVVKIDGEKIAGMQA